MVAVQHAAWQEAFIPILPPEFLMFDPEAFAPRLAESMSSEGVSSVIASESATPLGWITFGANRDADADSSTGEVRAIFVHPDVWRHGVGAALLDTALEGLARTGYRAATLWSFFDNERANAFYERHGFSRDGAEQRREFSAGALEVRLRRAL